MLSYILIMIVFGVATIAVYVATIHSSNQDNLNMNIDLIGQISALTFAIFTGGFAFWQFAEYQKDKERQKLVQIQHVLKAIYYQLRDNGWLTNTGYKLQDKKCWIETNFLKLIDPRSRIDFLRYSFIESANSLPGVAFLNSEINSLMAGYTLWCTIFNNYASKIQKFILSRKIEESTNLIKIIDGVSPKISLSDFKKGLTATEIDFVNALLNMYERLYFEIVAYSEDDSQQPNLFFYHRKLNARVEEALMANEKTLKD